MPSDTAAVRRWLDDIHYHIVLAEKFAEGMSYDALRNDLRTTYAVTRCLEIISEASRSNRNWRCWVTREGWLRPGASMTGQSADAQARVLRAAATRQVLREIARRYNVSHNTIPRLSS